MSQASVEIRLQILLQAAKIGDPKARAELTSIAIQFLEGDGVPQHTPFGLGLLKNLATYGDKVSQDALAEKIGDFALQISKDKPELAFNLFALASELGDIYAKRNLAVFFFKGQGTERRLDKAIALLKECYEAGEQSALEGINAMASQFLSEDDAGRTPDLQKAVELFTFAAQKGHVVALKNLGLLGVWFYSGISPCPQDLPQGIAILKIAVKLGDKKALDNLVGVGAEMMKKDVEHSIKVFAYAVQYGHQDAQHNLFVLANHFLAWKKFELGADYGIQQNIPKGLRILHYLANLKNPAATEQLAQIRALKIPIPMSIAKSAASKPNILMVNSTAALTLYPSTPEEPHSPCTAEFLRKNDISTSASYVCVEGNRKLSIQDITRFKAERNAQKLKHFTDVLAALNQHFPPVSPIQEIVCGYIPNEVSPLFFQYQRAIAALDKEPQLECLSMSAEETLGDSNHVKLHVSCT
ncbi:MAG TPA: tetratricopeptide repeat protein [Gammaproteobacteria bacterium]|nr:tetratricopeptide repeat protein [Gammaproteobacteria bacterium]